MPRDFYTNDQNTTPLPGTVVTASDAQIEALGPNKLINGSSVRSPSVLESPLSSARITLNSWINTTQNTIDSWAEAFHTKEQHFTSTIANLHHRDEDLLTSGIYVLVAGLSGTILTRRSNFLLKGVVPLVFGTLAFKYVLPRTFSNTADFAHDIETVKAPGLAKKQDELIKDVGLLISQTESKAKDVELVTESKLKSLKDSFKKYTGLRVDEDVTK